MQKSEFNLEIAKIDEIFFQTVVQTNQYYKIIHESLKKIRFPEIYYTTQGDDTFKKIWDQIDNAKTYIWLLTYQLDDTFIGRTTMLKLINAQKRGVKVVILVDDLNQWVRSDMKKQLRENGGIFQSLNPAFKNMFSRNFFRRHHEKLIAIDDWVMCGSSNISDEYSGAKYGTFDFQDLNLMSKNIWLEDIRGIFGKYANMYQFKLDDQLSNQEVLIKYNDIYPDSEFIQNKQNYKFIRSDNQTKDIQNQILNIINNAKKEIVIIQPYYYPIRKIENALTEALKRGVKVDLITSAKRDQPCYRRLSNVLMTHKLIKKGLNVYEMHDKLLHMKAYYADDEIFTVGSFNNDKISWRVNKEANVVVQDIEEAKKLKKIIQDLRNQCKYADPNKKIISLIRYQKIKFWEFILRGGDFLMYKQFKIRNQFFLDWDLNLERI